jgi:hypothetical protein
MNNSKRLAQGPWYEVHGVLLSYTLKRGNQCEIALEVFSGDKDKFHFIANIVI